VDGVLGSRDVGLQGAQEIDRLAGRMADQSLDEAAEEERRLPVSGWTRTTGCSVS
jgi:hypothetical protein